MNYDRSHPEMTNKDSLIKIEIHKYTVVIINKNLQSKTLFINLYNFSDLNRQY